MSDRHPVNVTLFGDRVLVKAIDSPKGSIIRVSDDNWRYEVIVVGTGRASEYGQWFSPPVKVGDVIVVDPNRIVSVYIGGHLRKIVNSPDILAKE